MSVDGNKIMSVAAAKVLYDDLRQRVNNKLETNLKGIANGLAELDSAGKVPANQLPSYVDDVLEFATLNNFPVTGESGKIYIALDTNLTYRWSGSTYTVISSSLALGETESTAYRGDRGAIAYNHANNKGNAYSKGLYKITTNTEGHVINAQNVIKQDITNLGIPSTVPTKVSQLQNDSGFISSYTETDPTVPSWAKSPTKPAYTANEVGALPDTTIIPSKTSDLINDVGYLTQHQDISGKADIEDIPTKVSDLTNDAGYLTAHQDISGKADVADIPTKVSDLVDDSGHYIKPSGGIPASDLASGVIPDLTNYVQNTDYISDNDYGIARTNASLGITANSSGIIRTSPATSAQIKTGTESYKPISPVRQHEAMFYGLAKAAGDTTQAQSNNAVGTYTDDAKSAIQTMLGTARKDVVYVNQTYSGTTIYQIDMELPAGDYSLTVDNVQSTDTDVDKCLLRFTDGDGHQVYAYELSRGVASSINFSLSRKAIHMYLYAATTYPISMNDTFTFTNVRLVRNLNNAVIEALKNKTETISITGSTPTITAIVNCHYICGEVTALNFTPCATGICDVRFTSGSTVTVLTVPNTVKWPEWFDPTNLEVNMIYEINIEDGIYGVVMAWPV